MSIDKNKVKKKVKELRKVANNPILNAIALIIQYLTQ